METKETKKAVNEIFAILGIPAAYSETEEAINDIYSLLGIGIKK